MQHPLHAAAPPRAVSRTCVPLLALAAVVLLGACAPQGVREDAVSRSPEDAARHAVLIEPGSPPPDAGPPSDAEILARLRERAAARRAAAAQLRMDTGAARPADLWARIRAGMRLPPSEHPAVRAELEWYAARPDYVQRTTDRARLYLAYIVREAERRELPLELALLPVVESAFQPYARSPAGAMGIWQFIRSTGRRFGLHQSAWYDARRDIVESTRAAFEYLERLHRDLDGDWLLAVAAYNAGEGNVLRARARNRARGAPEDFFSLALPAETRAYVPRLLAFSALVRNPEVHGLTLDPIDDAPYFRRVEVGSQIDLALAAEMAGVTLNEMMLLNPGFFRHATDPNGPHHLLVPAESAAAFEQALASTDPAERVAWGTHVVARGDTLIGIAGRYGVSVDEIRDANGKDSTLLRVGETLKVPGSGAAREVGQLSPEVRRGIATAVRSEQRQQYRVRRGDSLWSIARAHRVSLARLMQWNGLGKRSILRPGQKLVIHRDVAPRRGTGAPTREQTPQVHVVESGDSLWHIARRYGLRTNDLARWNGISVSATLHPGQTLRLSAPQQAARTRYARG